MFFAYVRFHPEAGYIKYPLFPVDLDYLLTWHRIRPFIDFKGAMSFNNQS